MRNYNFTGFSLCVFKWKTGCKCELPKARLEGHHKAYIIPNGHALEIIV